MLRLEHAAQRFGQGQLDVRTHFDSTSSLFRVGVAFNQMAENINTLVASKKQLIDGIAHELRTPLVRLRYRLEMSDNLSEAESAALNRDVSQLESLIEELLTYARLDRPRVDLNLQSLDLASWLRERMEDFQAINPDTQIELDLPQRENYGVSDTRLMERVLDNLVNNALRYANQRLRVSLWFDGAVGNLQVDDDGPGIPMKNVNVYLNPLSGSIRVATAQRAAVDLAWPSFTPSPMRSAAGFPLKPARLAVPACVLAGRSISRFGNFHDVNAFRSFV